MSKASTFKVHFMFGFLLTLIVFYRMAPAILSAGFTVSAPSGDGLGGMSWNYCMGEFIREFGWAKFLQDDIFYNPYFGGELNPKAVYFQPWKLVYGYLSGFLSIDQVWDWVIFIGILLTALSTYWIGILLKLRPIFAFATSFLLISTENIDVRITGHNTLAFWFAPMLMWGCMILWSRSFSWKWAIGLGLASILSVASNEYFAWYGGLFVASFGCMQLYFKTREQKIPISKILFQFLVSFLVLVVLARMIFPSMFLDLYDVVSKKPSASDYNLYSFRTPGSILVPNLLIEFNWLEHKWHGVKGEMTFRLGLVFWVCFGFLVAKYKNLRTTFTEKNSPAIISLVVSGLQLLCAALPIDSFPWISLLFSEIVPMFRSIVRAMLFFNIAMIFLFFFMLQAYCDHLKSVSGTKKISVLSAVLTPLLLFDMGPFHRNFKPYPIFALPEAQATEIALANLERGLLLELPIENRKNEKGLDSFMMHRYTLHHKPILNWVASSIPSHFEHAYEYMRQISQTDPDQLIDVARSLGVKYLLIENSYRKFFQSKDLEETAKGSSRTAYLIKNSQDITVDRRREIMLSLNQKPLILGPYLVP